MPPAATNRNHPTPDALQQAGRLRRAHRLTSAQERVLRSTPPQTWRRTDASLGTLHALVGRDLVELRLTGGCVEFRLTPLGAQLHRDLSALVGTKR